MDYLLISVSDSGDPVQTSSPSAKVVQGLRKYADKGNQKFQFGPPKFPSISTWHDLNPRFAIRYYLLHTILRSPKFPSDSQIAIS